MLACRNESSVTAFVAVRAVDCVGFPGPITEPLSDADLAVRARMAAVPGGEVIAVLRRFAGSAVAEAELPRNLRELAVYQETCARGLG